MQRIARPQGRTAPGVFPFLCLLLIAGAFASLYSFAPGALAGDCPSDQPGHAGQLAVEVEEAPSPPDYTAIGANELGLIPILMYHEIGPGSGEWCRTPEDFRADLERLYDTGYSLIDLSELIDNHVSTPAGRSPVVLTFDDGNAGQMRYLEQPDGTVLLDPDCAVAILLEFAARHPDFGLAATFFIYYPLPFRQSKYVGDKLRELDRLGLSIGNHTLGHINLGSTGAEEIQFQLARMVSRTCEYVPRYEIRSLALPYGNLPPRPLRPLLLAGSYEGQEYRHEAVLLVGANPCPAPNAVGFDLTRLPRIRGSQPELDRWLGYLEEHPELRYVSDGDPSTVVYPEAAAAKLDRLSLGDREAIEYREARDGTRDGAAEDGEGPSGVPWPEPK